ncbi:MAG TPA: histone deacetylase [Bryobacteraceae bacterium]|nr:histone deacetylase [Bryobacteraceae bacterium]
MAKTALLLDAGLYRQHAPGEGHPERPERVEALATAFEREGIVRATTQVRPRPASDDELAALHSREYIALVRRDVARGSRTLSTGDTEIMGKSLEVALHAAGGVLNAVDAVMSGSAPNAFCAVRPPGHHASPARGMGFCVFNNVAVAARYAQKRHGAARAMIVDWDVHHGNGTQDAFYSDGSVLFFSTHQSPWYPGTGAVEERGEGKGRGLILNRPLPAGAARTEITAAFREALLPAAVSFKPDVVFISAGFDSREGDPLGRFRLSDQDFADLTRLMMDFADQHCGGRIVSVLEGGYSLSGLAASATAHVRTLMTAAT